MKTKLISNSIAFFFVGTFLYSGLTKFLTPGEFMSQVQQSPILAGIPAGILWAIPVVELITALLLLIPSSRLMGLILSVSLMTIFTIYIVILNLFTYYVPCSCGGILNSIPKSLHILLNITLLSLSFYAIYTNRVSKKINQTYQQII